jgi:MFS family permease
MRALTLVATAWLLVASATARAQAPAAVDPLNAYRQQALGARFSFWSGLRLVRGEQVVKLGFFGGGREEIFAGSPAALEAIDGYRRLRIGGTIMWAVGLATLVAELALLAADRDLFIAGESVRPLFWGMLIPGAVVGIAGGIMMQAANGYLSDAIERHNDDLYRRLSGERRVMLGLRRRF